MSKRIIIYSLCLGYDVKLYLEMVSILRRRFKVEGLTPWLKLMHTDRRINQHCSITNENEGIHSKLSAAFLRKFHLLDQGQPTRIYAVLPQLFFVVVGGYLTTAMYFS